MKIAGRPNLGYTVLGAGKPPGPPDPPPEAAGIQRPRIEDVTTIINRLAALLPDERRPDFKAKVVADFEEAAGITMPGETQRLDDRAAAKPGAVALDDAAKEMTGSKAYGLAWPTEKWKGSPEELSRKPHAIFAFLRRVWNPFIVETGAVVTRQMLFDQDIDAGIALRNALRKRSGARDKPTMPSDIRIVLTRELRKLLGIIQFRMHTPDG